jgi:hypothetical protein
MVEIRVGGSIAFPESAAAPGRGLRFGRSGGGRPPTRDEHDLDCGRETGVLTRTRVGLR